MMSRKHAYLRHIWPVLFLAGAAHAAELRGRVLDTSGAPIVRAELRLDEQHQAISDASGEFAFLDISPGAHTLVARAGGFAPKSLAVTVPSATELEISLQPGAGRETVVVTASRAAVALSETAESISVMDTIDQRPQLTGDDGLRQAPGFSLFRRTGVRIPNPTTAGPPHAEL